MLKDTKDFYKPCKSVHNNNLGREGSLSEFKQNIYNSRTAKQKYQIFHVMRDLFIYLFHYSFIHMCIHCLGHFPSCPPPQPSSPSLLHIQAEPVLPLSLILLKRTHKHNKEDKEFLVVKLKRAIQKYS
jgi:hypothetical protein